MFHLHAHHFNLSFVALGYNYVPTEELLDKEEEESAAIADEETEMGWVSLESSDGQDAEPIDGKESLQHFSQERQMFIKEKLDKWCADLGYKDTTVNMFTLSHSLDIPKAERFRNFSETDIISAECSFSSRTYQYRIFKLKEGCTPAEWREKMAENVASEGKKQD